MTNQLKDPQLAALSHMLALDWYSASDWQTRLQDQIQGPRCDTFLSLNAARAESANRRSVDTLPLDREFYRFVAADAASFRHVLEGRLGYYDAVLPRVADIVARGPHELIVDLGSHGGLGTLYLGMRFPESRVVGIERCAEAVSHARLFQAVVGVPNVEFIHSDYVNDVPVAGFDVVISLQTMPTYLLPRVPSASPESYLRGERLARAEADPASPVQLLRRALHALRRMCRAGGRALLHERVLDFPFAALFLYLASRAGLRNDSIQPLTWRTANEGDREQKGPLLVTEVQDGPTPFDEQAVLDFYLPGPAPLPSGPELQRGLTLTGPQAQFAFESLVNQRRDVCIEVVMKDGLQFNFHVGATETGLVYVYHCTSLDFRDFKICDWASRRQLFQPLLDYTDRVRNAVEVSSVSPGAAILRSRLEALT